MSRLKKQYKKNIKLFTKLGLWDFEWFLIIKPILQHCMPPPSIDAWRSLLERLIELRLSTNWCLMHDILKLNRALQQLPNGRPYRGDIGIEYPIFYAITHQKLYPNWPIQSQRDVIIELIEIVYKSTAPDESLKDHKHYYRHVYRLRDVLIFEQAKKQGLKIGVKTQKNLNEKREYVSDILEGIGWAGSDLFHSDVETFWEKPPIVKLKTQSLLSRSCPDKSDLTADPIETLDLPVDRSNEISKSGLLNSAEQKKELTFQLPNFIRNNVRSLADPNQLPWTSVLTYWKQLLSDGKEEVFILSLFALLTGIRTERWKNLIAGTSEEITSNNIVYDPEQNCLYYEVINFAAVFELRDGELSPTKLCLKLPTALCKLLDKLILQSVAEGLKESYPIRKFSKNHPGPSPTLNRVANSGLTLFRLHYMEDSEAFIISGTIPVEFRVRSCYASIDLVRLNQKFSNTVFHLFPYLNNNGYLQRNAIIEEKLKSLCSEPAKTVSPRMVGSQIGHTYRGMSFATSKLRKSMSLDISVRQKQIIQTLNNLETHLYWMLQYANGNRPSGPQTSSIAKDELRIHSDKGSKYYSESKFIFESAMVKKQLSEVHSARQEGYLQLERMGVTVNRTDLTTSRALQHKIHQQTAVCSCVPMQNTTAMTFAQENYGLSFPINRPNASRHHVSTFLHTHQCAQYADQCLGHHIEGWDLTAPESTAESMRVMTELKSCLDSLLQTLGFTVIRSPWS